MIKSDPSNAQFTSNHAVALIKIGDVDLRAGHAGQAISKYEQAAGLRERLNAAAPLDLLIRRDLAEAWIKLGDALKLAGKNNEALEYYRKSVETLKSVSSSIPADAEIRAMLEDAESKVGN